MDFICSLLLGAFVGYHLYNHVCKNSKKTDNKDSVIIIGNENKVDF